MVDKDKIIKYLQNLELYLDHLRELQAFELKQFLSDWKIYDLVDRKLHLTLETTLNLGEMLISEFGYRKPDSYADIPRILFENAIIDSLDLKDKLVDLARFRNILVHEYLYLDHERIYDFLQKVPDIISAYIVNIKKVLAGH